MDSSVSPKDEIWFLPVWHYISTGLYSSMDLFQCKTWDLCRIYSCLQKNVGQFQHNPWALRYDFGKVIGLRAGLLKNFVSILSRIKVVHLFLKWSRGALGLIQSTRVKAAGARCWAHTSISCPYQVTNALSSLNNIHSRPAQEKRISLLSYTDFSFFIVPRMMFSGTRVLSQVKIRFPQETWL